MSVGRLAIASIAAVGLAACHPPHPHAKIETPLRTVSALDCPAEQGDLTLKSAASDGQTCLYGTDNGGQYGVDTGSVTGPGSPHDDNAWFNVLPSFVGEQTFGSYYDSSTGNKPATMPYPGGKGKIWHCSTAKASAADSFLQGGQFGFWSYVMNLDLKLLADINAHGVVGNSYVYPAMPKLSALRHSSQQVLITEVAFSPTLEPYTSNPPRNGIFPAARWSYFSKRHNDRGTLVFTDGHAAIFPWKYVYNVAGGRKEVFNPDIWWNPNRDIP